MGRLAWHVDGRCQRSRHRYISLVLVALTMALLALALASCGDGDATPPPPTIIRADETPMLGGPTATPTSTATPGEAGYPGPMPTLAEGGSGYPSLVVTPPPSPAATSAYPGR